MFIVVALGLTNINQPENGYQNFLVYNKQDIIIHKDYNPDTLLNDVALLKLPSDITFNSRVQKINLPARSNNPPSYAYVMATASGWGKTKDSDPGVTDKLRFVDLRVITNAECKRYYVPGLVTDTTLCASTVGKRSTCSGDSGGPLVYGKTLIGVTSFVSTTGCEKQVPAGFSRVTKYLQWVKDNTGLNV